MRLKCHLQGYHVETKRTLNFPLNSSLQPADKRPSLRHNFIPINQCMFVLCFDSLKQPTARMADAETLLMETMDQNGNEGKDGQDEVEQELMMGEEDQSDDADGGKIEATKGDEDTG